MPISGPSSYLQTTDAFIAHWVSANTALGAGNALVVRGGITVDDLTAYRDALFGQRSVVTDEGINLALARADLALLVGRLLGRLVEFNERVRADLAETAYARVLPAAFSVGDAEDSVREALRGMRALWVKINAIAPAPSGVTLPVVLREGYTVAMLETDMTALRAAYRGRTEGEQAVKLAREQRNDIQDLVYDILKKYRLKLPTAFAPEDAMVASLPALTPAPGHTPAEVAIAAVWVPASSQAQVTWDESTDPELERYEVRGVPGGVYSAEDEEVLGSVAAGGTRELLTDFALGVPGLVAGFKVYVVLTTGNENGSAPAYVVRPA